MIIERNGIKLIRLTEDHIELVRQKRNLPEIQARMLYREYITPEMQSKWFESINNDNNYFFLIETNKTFIGLISASGIDWDNGIVNNGGIFIWNDHYLNSPEILYASLLLTDLGSLFGITKNYIRILNDNRKAIDFNKSIGYVLMPGQENEYNQKYELTADNYYQATDKIRQHQNFSGTIKIFATSKEYASDLKLIKGNKYLHQYRKITPVEIIINE